MNEKIQTAVESAAPPAPSAVSRKLDEPSKSKRQQKRDAQARIEELLAKLKSAALEHEQKAKALQDQIEKLHAELEERQNACLDLEEKLFEYEHAAARRLETAKLKEEQDRLLFMKALIDVAERTGVRRRHRDWDGRMELAEKKLATRLLSEILDMHRVGANPAELAYALSTDVQACARLSALAIAPDGAGIGEVVRILCLLAARINPSEAFLAATTGG